jgi:hypothetical protein
MKNTHLVTALSLFLIGLCNILSAQETQKPLSDAEMRQKIVGTWQLNSKSALGTLSAKGTYTIFTNGTFETKGTIVNNAGKKVATLNYEGEWQIQAGVFVETITKTSDPMLAPVGKVARDKIIKVDDKQRIYKRENGKTVTQERVK